MALTFNKYRKIVGEVTKISNAHSIDSTKGSYYGQLKNDKFHGKGYLQESKNVGFFGNFKNGKKNGLGVQHVIFDQVIYIGEFKDDEFDGKGILLTLPKKQKFIEVTYQMIIKHYPSLISFYEGNFKKSNLIEIKTVKFGVDKNWETKIYKIHKKTKLNLKEMKKHLNNVKWEAVDFGYSD